MIIDIHSHILPNVDDGSKDMSMSIEMARQYLENGIKKVIATPHYIQGSMDSSLEYNKNSLEMLREELLKEELNLEVLLGNEIYISMDIINDISDGKVSTLNNTRYILLELPMYDIPLYTETILYDLQIEGYIPIIAHPERNGKIIEDPNILYKYIDRGALAQLNLPSIDGMYGSKIKSTAEILLKHNMIHFLGTDAHTDRKRSPNILKSIKILKDLIDKEEFENISYRNGELVLKDELIQRKEAKLYQPKFKSIFSFLKRK